MAIIASAAGWLAQTVIASAGAVQAGAEPCCTGIGLHNCMDLRQEHRQTLPNVEENAPFRQGMMLAVSPRPGRAAARLVNKIGEAHDGAGRDGGRRANTDQSCRTPSRCVTGRMGWGEYRRPASFIRFEQSLVDVILRKCYRKARAAR